MQLRSSNLDLYKESLLASSPSNEIVFDSGLSLENKKSYIYRIIHSFIGRTFLLPVSSHISSNRKHVAAMACQDEHEWHYTPVALDLAGKRVHAMAVTKKDSVFSGDWVLGIFGRNNSLESRLANTTKGKNKELIDCADQKFRHILSEISPHTNALVFNYTDYEISKELAVKSTRAALRVLIDKEKGIGADTVHVYQYSFGAALGYQAIHDELIDGTDLSAIKDITSDRTFNELKNVSNGLIGRIINWILEFFGWSIKPAEIANQLDIPQNIIVTTNDKEEVIFDGVISPKASLASSIEPREKRKIFPIKANHSGFLPLGLFTRIFNESATAS